MPDPAHKDQSIDHFISLASPFFNFRVESAVRRRVDGYPTLLITSNITSRNTKYHQLKISHILFIKSFKNYKSID